MALGLMVVLVGLLGCGGIGGLAWVVSSIGVGRQVEGLVVNTEPCGEWEAEVTASGAGGDLVLRVNGEEHSRWITDGSKRYLATGTAPLGSTVSFETQLGKGPVRTVRRPMPDLLQVSLPKEPFYEKEVPESFTASLLGECRLSNPHWEAEISGTHRSSGYLTPDGKLKVPLVDVTTRGNYSLRLKVKTGRVLLADTQSTLVVKPPCQDADQDGVSVCLHDCDDNDPTIHPGAQEISNDGKDNDCDGLDGFDGDQDGHASKESGGDDCDDRNPQVHPGRSEAPNANNLDDDCDGVVDEGTRVFDDDGDGFSEEEGDCDDQDSRRHPKAAELPDCLDQNCNGKIDEGIPRRQVDDAYENNDRRESAHDLKTSRRRRFSRDLTLITRNVGDTEWFRFFSHDGGWDDWGITVTIGPVPERASYRVEVLDSTDGVRVSRIVSGDGATLRVKGTWKNDTGDYYLSLTPLSVGLEWCPLEVTVSSR